MRRVGNKLSAITVRNATKPGLYGDGHGLYLQVSRQGTKAWLFRFMLDGVARKMGLGPVHTISLAEARRRASEARLLVHDRLDPIEVRRGARAKLQREAAKSISFKECAEKYIESNHSSWRNPKHRRQWSATFSETKRGTLSFPAITELINDLPVATIDTALVLKVLEPIWLRTPETASRVRGRIETVLDWARVREFREGENPARWKGHLDQVLPARSAVAPVKHRKALAYRELPEFMSLLSSKSGTSARALEFTILTAARTGEVIGARWSEIDETEKLWLVPAGRMKGGREHRVPLSDRAIAILGDRLRHLDLIFPLSNMAMLELVRDMLGKGSTVHGFRSTFRDWACETTSYPNEICEIALAHVVSDKTEAAYRRGDMMDKRRRLMMDWASYCSGLINIDNV
jgi:integrase